MEHATSRRALRSMTSGFGLCEQVLDEADSKAVVMDGQETELSLPVPFQERERLGHSPLFRMINATVCARFIAESKLA